MNTAQKTGFFLFLMFAIPITGMVVTGGLKFAPLYILPALLAYTVRWQCRLSASWKSFRATWEATPHLD